MTHYGYWWVIMKGKKAIVHVESTIVTVVGSCKFYQESDVEEWIEQIPEPIRKEMAP